MKHKTEFITRRSIVKMIGAVLAISLAAVLASPVFAATDYSITKPGDYCDINGARFEEWGITASAGTGVYDTFLKVGQGNPTTSKGYNSDFSGKHGSPEYDEGVSWTHTKLTVDVPSVDPASIVGTDRYREFQLDINQSGSGMSHYITLDTVEIYLTSNEPNLDGFYGGFKYALGQFTLANGFKRVYDMDAGGDNTILINFEINAGSGKRDVIMWVPDSAGWYTYKYAILYTEHGADLYSGPVYEYAKVGKDWEWVLRSWPEQAYPNNDGFEEWGVALYKATKTGYKWNDLNADGFWDAGEPGLAGWTIWIDDGDGIKEEGEPFAITAADGSYTISNITPGTYDVRELPPEGETGWICSYPEGGFYDDEVFGNGGYNTNNFGNYRLGCLEVTKAIDWGEIIGRHADVPDVDFIVTVTGPSYPDGHNLTFQLIDGVIYGPDDGATACLCDLIPGNYTASEVAPDGWEDAVITGSPALVEAGDECDDGAPEITVTNEPTPGCLEVTKVISLGTYGVAPDALFDVVISGPSYPAGEELTVSFKLENGVLYVYDADLEAWVEGDSYCLCDLIPGNYTASEVAPDGWEDAVITGSPALVEAGDECDEGAPMVTVTNTPKARIQVIKYTDGECSTTVDWQFQLSGGDLSSPIVDSTNHTIPDCELDFGGVNLTPDVTYTLCEYVDDLPTAGWTVNGTWQISGDPSGPTPIVFTWDPVNETYCTDFFAGAGETIVFTINNIPPPGGEPRTPGYWKNWTKCDGKGKQEETAANNGGWEAGFWLLDDIIGPYPGSTTNPAATPVLIGDLLVDTCQEGVAILDTRDVISGTKKGGDAAYMLARNLLAAYLNYGAGACTDPYVTTKMAEAQALLDTANFTGTGNYWKGGKTAAANRATALSLASILDDYNNGMYCP